MRYKSIAFPTPSKGVTYEGVKKSVVPNQALTLQQILERFTRGEAVNVARDGNYHDGEDDLEKMSHLDLVDKEEYIQKLKTTQKDYEKQERKKVLDLKKAAEKQALDEARAAQKAAPSASEPPKPN